jgi:Farnesoic acid 0-methyl transferase
MRPLVLVLALAAVAGCKIEKLPPAGPSSDDFQRAQLGDTWLATGGNWRIDNGELVIDHAYNHPLWLRKPIPQDAIIELDCWSNDDVGDLKVEAWGDGKSFATTPSYTATSYVFIFGGWHNQISAIARMNEHGNDRRPRADVRVQKGKRYHWRISRRGGHIDWQIDGKPFLSFDDPDPLEGRKHSYFAFNDWEAELHFDNLKITPQ